MQKLLISNPFLFAPSGDNEEEKALFDTRKEKVKNYLLYTFKEFDKAWNKASEDKLDNKAGDLFPMNTPPNTSRQEESNVMMDTNFFDNFDNWMHEYSFAEDDTDPFQVMGGNSSGLDKEFNGEKSVALDENFQNQGNDLLPIMNQALNSIDIEASMNLESYSEDLKKASDQISEKPSDANPGAGVELQQQADMEGLNCFSQGNFDILEIAANDPEPTTNPIDVEAPSTSTVDTSAIQQHHPIPISQITSQQSQQLPNYTAVVKIEPEVVTPSSSSVRPSRQRRKSVQTSRNIVDTDSSMIFQTSGEQAPSSVTVPKVEAKSSQALAPLNGTGNRSRHISNMSSSPSTPQPSSSKSRDSSKGGSDRKKRKYEEEDDNDPSVKNAKAAKMNRDKKKQELQILRTRVNALESENQKIKQERMEAIQATQTSDQQYRRRISQLEQELAEERRRNSINSMSKVRMLDMVTHFIQGYHTQYPNTPPPSVFLSTKMANMPMPPMNEMPAIREQLQSTPNAISNDQTYLTIKVGVGGAPSIAFDCDENSKDN